MGRVRPVGVTARDRVWTHREGKQRWSLCSWRRSPGSADSALQVVARTSSYSSHFICGLRPPTITANGRNTTTDLCPGARASRAAVFDALAAAETVTPCIAVGQHFSVRWRWHGGAAGRLEQLAPGLRSGSRNCGGPAAAPRRDSVLVACSLVDGRGLGSSC